MTKLATLRETVPEGLHRYDISETDESGVAGFVDKKHVVWPHWGTILSVTEFPVNEHAWYEIKNDVLIT